MHAHAHTPGTTTAAGANDIAIANTTTTASSAINAADAAASSSSLCERVQRRLGSGVSSLRDFRPRAHHYYRALYISLGLALLILLSTLDDEDASIASFAIIMGLIVLTFARLFFLSRSAHRRGGWGGLGQYEALPQRDADALLQMQIQMHMRGLRSATSISATHVRLALMDRDFDGNG